MPRKIPKRHIYYESYQIIELKTYKATKLFASSFQFFTISILSCYFCSTTYQAQRYICIIFNTFTVYLMSFQKSHKMKCKMILSILYMSQVLAGLKYVYAFKTVTVDMTEERASETKLHFKTTCCRHFKHLEQVFNYTQYCIFLILIQPI